MNIKVGDETWDLQVRDFPHEGRSGGSYTKTLTLEPGGRCVP